MSNIVEAVYENGVFRPLSPVGLREHQRVTVQYSGEPDTLIGQVEPWTEENNARRCDLIDKEIEGSLSPAEKAELELLQRQAVAYRDRVAPLPMMGARKLHQELLQKKRAAQR